MTLSQPHVLEEEVTRLRARVAELERSVAERHRDNISSDEMQELSDAFFFNMPVFAWVKDDDGRYVYANRKIQEYWQSNGESGLGKNDANLLPPSVASSASRATTWKTSRFCLPTKPGKSFLGAISVEEEETRDQAVIHSRVLSLLDTLRQSETRIDQMFHSELTGMVECDGTAIVDANDALLGWLGMTRGELQDIPLDWRDLSTAKARLLDEDCLRQLRETGVCRAYEKTLHARDGRTIPVMACASVLDPERGSFIGFFLNLSDCREVGARLLRSQKLESLGLIAGGVAHDFNNLLATIMGNASLALGNLTSDHPAYRPLTAVLMGSRRASNLTQQMLAYSGRADFQIRSIDLSSAVKEIGSLLETTISKKLDLIFRLAGDLPSMEGDEGQVQQVIMNLVINASHAIGENPGGMTVSTYVGEGEHSGYVCFEVRDTGCGMDEATRKRIFDPFFTTKTHGRGLGLAAVMNVMRNHEGSLVVESAPGKGSTFRAYFPASNSPAPVAPENRSRELRGNEGILVVDDDESIRRMNKASLERFGYKVLLASNGADAVEMYRRHEAEISVILLDWAMPVMNGEEALLRIHEINPQAKVLLSSGYAETETVRRIGSGSLAGFLQKPYTTTQLAERMREVMALTAA